jgi:predicted nucleic acid-binding protein
VEKVVLDSDIIIDYLRTGKGRYEELLKLQLAEKIQLYLSSVTVMELFAGKMDNDTEKLLTELVNNFIIIPFDKTLAKFTGLAKNGKKIDIPLADFIIAQTAIFLEAKLATRNAKDFRQIPSLKFYGEFI